MQIVIRVDEVVVQTEDERAAAAKVPEVLKEAFYVLAEALARSPFARWHDLGDLVVSELEPTPLSSDELLGPRGAALLAERLYTSLMERAT